jgi:hypothetical protein
MIAIGPTTSEELRSQSIIILKMHKNVKVSLLIKKIVESKWKDNIINYTL